MTYKMAINRVKQKIRY